MHHWLGVSRVRNASLCEHALQVEPFSPHPCDADGKSHLMNTARRPLTQYLAHEWGPPRVLGWVSNSEKRTTPVLLLWWRWSPSTGGLLPDFILELLDSGSVYPSRLRLPLCYLQPMPEAPSKDVSLQNQPLCGLVQKLCPVHDI